MIKLKGWYLKDERSISTWTHTDTDTHTHRDICPSRAASSQLKIIWNHYGLVDDKMKKDE